MAFELAVPSSWNTVSTDFHWRASHHEGVNVDVTFPERPCLPALSYNTHHPYSLSPFLLAPDIFLGICLLFCLSPTLLFKHQDSRDLICPVHCWEHTCNPDIC